MAEGIEVRTAKDGTRTYRASVWSNRDGQLIRKSSIRGGSLTSPGTSCRTSSTGSANKA